MTKEEVKDSTIQGWFDNEIESENIYKEVPPQPNSIGHLRIAFVWSFFYLKNGWKYEDALEDILLGGGDTDTNAAIVGGLLGAAQGYQAIDEK